MFEIYMNFDNVKIIIEIYNRLKLLYLSKKSIEQ